MSSWTGHTFQRTHRGQGWSAIGSPFPFLAIYFRHYISGTGWTEAHLSLILVL